MTRVFSDMQIVPSAYNTPRKSADPLGVSEYIELSYVADLAIRPLLTAKVTG